MYISKEFERMDPFAKILVESYYRINNFKNKTWAVLTYKNIILNMNNGDVFIDPIMSDKGVFKNNTTYPYKDFVSYTITENYTFPVLNAVLFITTHVVANRWCRTIEYLDLKYKVVPRIINIGYGPSFVIKNDNYHHPFIRYRILSSFVDKLKQHNINYTYYFANDTMPKFVVVVNKHNITVDETDNFFRLQIDGEGRYNSAEIMKALNITI
jgi:hypothetical protein